MTAESGGERRSPSCPAQGQDAPEAFLERLSRWAMEKPDATSAVILDGDGNPSADLSFGALDAALRRLSAALLAAGARGQAVLLPAEQTTDFIIAFCACLHAGAIATPVPPAQRPQAVARLQGIMQDAGISHALFTGPASRVMAEHLPAVLWVEGRPENRIIDRPHSDGPALLQYSSGSTSAPKGVVITHANLAANLAMAERHFAVEAHSRILTWLPLYHDMGLIGQLMLALYAGCPFYAMRPIAFVQRPQRWLSAISRHRITISGASNFAYDLCVSRAARDLPEDLRLDSWSVAFCGAEPVRAATLARFAATFGPHGFDQQALFPCYGLAEATVFVSGGPVRSGVTTLSSLTGAKGSRGQLVSCGQIAGHVAIVDAHSRQPLPDGVEGEIWIRGEHVGAGYWNTDADEVFRARTCDGGDRQYLRSGDYGLIESGQLFVTGRIKDLIIHRGSNVHPEDVERTVETSHPNFGPAGACFATGADDDEIVIVAEVANAAVAGDFAQMENAAVKAVGNDHGIRLKRVVLVRPGTIPRTTSGKVRRSACRDAYRAGMLKPIWGDPFGLARDGTIPARSDTAP